MKIIVGLGNPGLKYKNTRHNIGFLVLKVLSKRHGIPVKKKAFKGLYGIGRIAAQEVMLFEPMTYMNLSGQAVKEAIYAKLECRAGLLVISDDTNLAFGNIRLRSAGSSGGHNGLASIIEEIGPDFARLRVGIKREEKIHDMADYVLSSFSRGEKALLTGVLGKAADAAENWASYDIKAAMSKYNSKSNG